MCGYVKSGMVLLRYVRRYINDYYKRREEQYTEEFVVAANQRTHKSTDEAQIHPQHHGTKEGGNTFKINSASILATLTC